MVIALRPLTGLDPAQVVANLDIAVGAIQEDNPNLDASRRGSVYDILAYYHAVLATQLLQSQQDYLDGRSLAVLNATADPTLLADQTLVDDAASNFGVIRMPGAAAAGTVAVVVSSSTTLTLAAGFSFQAAGLVFTTAQTYTAKIDPTQIINAGDVLMTALGGNRWRFTIAVTCTSVGVAGNLAGGTLLTPTITPANFVTATAAGSFTGGLDTETTPQLLARLAQGIACKAPSNRVNYAALLRGIAAFSSFVATSIVGLGDAEQLRDKHSILPLALGGRVDWYVRMQEALLFTHLTVTATCVSVNSMAGTSVWQFNLARNAAPGVYEIRNIRRAADVSGGFALVSDTRAVDLSGPAWVPDIVSAVEGDYSRYATTVIRFTDTLTPVGGLVPNVTTASYTCDAVGQPLIDAIQDTLASSEDGRSRSADVLVKAPVPCFTTVSFNLYTPAAVAAPALAPIKNAVAHAVNTVGFTGNLYASTIQAAVAPFLVAGQTTGATALAGRVRPPGGGATAISGTDVLTVPADPGNMVSAKTVQFYLAPGDVTITVVPV